MLGGSEEWAHLATDYLSMAFHEWRLPAHHHRLTLSINELAVLVPAFQPEPPARKPRLKHHSRHVAARERKSLLSTE